MSVDVPSERTHVQLRSHAVHVPLIDKTFLHPLPTYNQTSFFDLLSHDCSHLIFSHTSIKFLRAGRAQCSQGVPFTKELDLELPRFSVCPLYQNTVYFSTYLHNLSNVFLNSTLAQSFLDAQLPDTTIHVINLKERSDRWQRVSDIPLQTFTLSRFEAVKGRTGLAWEGCARSHVDIVAAAKKRRAPYVIVAEDDFGCTIHTPAWERRLWVTLHWLLRNPTQWGVFNGHPCGFLVDSPISVLSHELGIVEMPGGLNTHFLVYNSAQYDRVLAWYHAYNPLAVASLMEAYDPTALARLPNPDLSSFSNTKVHLLAIDTWLSDHCTVVTALPMLTTSVHDDSDVIGCHTMEDTMRLKLTTDFQDWLSRIDSSLTLDNVYSAESQTILEPWKHTHTYRFYTTEIPKLGTPEEQNRSQSETHFSHFSQILHHFYDVWHFLKVAEPLFARPTLSAESDVTVVCTSCGRWSCLHSTLSSFFRVNSYPVKAVIVVEDSGSSWMADNIRRHFPQVTLLFDGECQGQLARIREVWAAVDTEYVFHMEDDWYFLRPFFIENSRLLLSNDNSLLNVWLRDIDDTNLHPIHPKMHQCKGIIFWKLIWGYDEVWNGFTWNPTLLRYNEVAPVLLNYAGDHNALAPEVFFSEHFRSLGLSAAILPGGFIVHTGFFSVASGDNSGVFQER